MLHKQYLGSMDPYQRQNYERQWMNRNAQGLGLSPNQMSAFQSAVGGMSPEQRLQYEQDWAMTHGGQGFGLGRQTPPPPVPQSPIRSAFSPGPQFQQGPAGVQPPPNPVAMQPRPAGLTPPGVGLQPMGQVPPGPQFQPPGSGGIDPPLFDHRSEFREGLRQMLGYPRQNQTYPQAKPNYQSPGSSAVGWQAPPTTQGSGVGWEQQPPFTPPPHPYDRFSQEQRNTLGGLDRSIARANQINSVPLGQMPRPERQPTQTQPYLGGQQVYNPLENAPDMNLSGISRFGAPPGTAEWRKTNVGPSGQVTIGPDLGIMPGYGNQPQQAPGWTGIAMPEDERRQLADDNRFLSEQARKRDSNISGLYSGDKSPVARGLIAQMNSMGMPVGDVSKMSASELSLTNLQNVAAYHGIDTANKTAEQLRSDLAGVRRGISSDRKAAREGRLAIARQSSAQEAYDRRSRLSARRGTPDTIEEQLINQNPGLYQRMVEMDQVRGLQQNRLNAEFGEEAMLIGLLDAIGKSSSPEAQAAIPRILERLGVGRPAETDVGDQPAPPPPLRSPRTRAQAEAQERQRRLNARSSQKKYLQGDPTAVF